MIQRNPQAFPPKQAMKKLVILAVSSRRRRPTAQTPAVDAALAAGTSESDTTVMGCGRRRRRRAEPGRGHQHPRRELYISLAARKGASPQDVGITAGCQLLARVGAGEAYLLGGRRMASPRARPIGAGPR